MSLFWYTRKEVLSNEEPIKDNEEPEIKEQLSCFNINKIIRGIVEGNKLLLLLDDFFERVESVPDINPKTNKQIGFKRVRNT